MLAWAVIFLVISIIAGLFGFRAAQGIAAQIAKILFFIFLILFVISLVYQLFYQIPPGPVLVP